PRPAAPPPGRSPAWSCRRPSGCPPPPTADRAPSSEGDGSGWHPALPDALWSLAVKKTSVYLPEALKERLAAGGRGPRGPARHRPGPALVGVGVGPGDPGLVTRRAVEVLRDADRVVAPSTSAMAVGRAEAIVREVAPDVAWQRVPSV